MKELFRCYKCKEYHLSQYMYVLTGFWGSKLACHDCVVEINGGIEP